ncbi:unnamed protein product, partial [Mesorhabditis spiculigera]
QNRKPFRKVMISQRLSEDVENEQPNPRKRKSSEMADGDRAPSQQCHSRPDSNFDPNGPSPPWSPEPSYQFQIINAENEEIFEDPGQHLAFAGTNEAITNAGNQEIVESQGQHLACAESEETIRYGREQDVDAQNEQDQNAENAKALEAENAQIGAAENQPSQPISEGCVASSSGFVPQGLWDKGRSRHKLEAFSGIERLLNHMEKDETDKAKREDAEAEDDEPETEEDDTESGDEASDFWKTPGDEDHNDLLLSPYENQIIDSDGQAQVDRLPDAQLRRHTRDDDHRLATEENLHRLLEKCVYEDLSDPQKAATVRCIRGGGKFLLFDEGGLGKSMVALATMSFFSEDSRLLIVTTPQSIEKWENLVSNYLRDAKRVTVLDKDQRLRRDRKIDLVYICSYNILNARIGDFERFEPQAIIFDESHHVKNWRSSRTKNSRNLATQAKRAICIASFPLHRSPNDLISQIRMILPDLWIEFEVDEYGRRWMCPEQTKRFLDAISSRQTKEEWLPSIPPKHRTLHHIKIPQSRQLQRAGRRAEAIWRAYLESEDDKRMLTDSRTALGKYYRLCVKAKAQHVAPYVRELFFSPNQNQPKTLIFGYHKIIREAIKKQLEKVGIRFVELDIPAGTEPFEERIQQFKDDSEINVAVLSLRASSLGLDLPEAKRIIFPELYYTVALHLQAEDRAHRFGQGDQVKIHYLADTTMIDEMILSIWESRAKCMEERELTGVMKPFDDEIIEQPLRSRDFPDGYDADGDSDPDASGGEDNGDEDDDDDDIDGNMEISPDEADDLASDESDAGSGQPGGAEATDDDESEPAPRESPALTESIGSQDTENDEEEESDRYESDDSDASGHYPYVDKDYVPPSEKGNQEKAPGNERAPRQSSRLQKSSKKASRKTRKAKFDDDSEDDSENRDPAMQQKDSEIESEDDSNQPSTSRKHRRVVHSSDESE